MNRLLKPDMTQENSAQNKKFEGFGSTINKSASVREFYPGDRKLAKEFQDTREFSARSFSSEKFRGTDTAANLLTRSTLPEANSHYRLIAATALKDAAESRKTSAVREYAETRPFLDKGKSQKAISQHNKPMTFDEVRELLNKNK